jgi:hypothetical protein
MKRKCHDPMQWIWSLTRYGDGPEKEDKRQLLEQVGLAFRILDFRRKDSQDSRTEPPFPQIDHINILQMKDNAGPEVPSSSSRILEQSLDI